MSEEERFQRLRQLEALLFAAREPITPAEAAKALPESPDAKEVQALIEDLAGLYANRGVVLRQIGKAYAFRTAGDLGHLFTRHERVEKKLSKAALECLAIVAYHQPVTRGEIEEIRGVSLSRGSLDVLVEAGWVMPKGRREAPGRPMVWGTTSAFLDHFGLEELASLPGLEELKAAGLLDSRPALTALSERGLLKDVAGEEETEAEEEETAESLSDDFGETLLEEEEGADPLPEPGTDRRQQ